MMGEKKGSLLGQWKNRDKEKSVKTVISKAPLDATIPLTHGQRRLWFLQQLYPESPFYNYSESYVIKGNLDTNNLIKALEMVCNNHDILRSTYHLEDGQLYIKISPKTEIAFADFDLNDLPEEEKSEATKKIMDSDARTLFDLTTMPVVLCSLIKMREDEHIMLLTLHHISTDKWSMGVLRNDLARYYTALCSGTNPEVKKSEIQFSDFAHWQSIKGVDQEQLDYWKNKLSGEIPFLNLPTDFKRPLQVTFEGRASKPQFFSKQLSEAILALAKKLDVTPYVLFISVYYVQLYRYSGQEDILIGSPIASRDQKALENIIGFFNDTVVLRTKLLPSMSFKDLCQKVKQATLEAFSNKDVPFDLLVKALKLERSLAVNPFFQVMFLYHSVPETPSFGPNLDVSYKFYDAGVSKFDLTVYISEENGLLSSTYEYSTDLFEDATIERFQQHFKLILEGITADPNQSLSTINMLTGKEEDFFFSKSIGAYQSQIPFRGIHQVIEAICDAHPNKIALTYKDTSITYGELDHRAALWAYVLLKKTKNRNEIVGLCIERSLDMIVGLVAILKAGCAYLPIDPEYPSQRIDYILTDADVNVVITQDSLMALFEQSNTELLMVENLDFSKPSLVVDLPKVAEDSLAYVIYTSGSTGQPKGVPISHKKIIGSTLGRSQFYGNDPSTFLLLSSISFDSSKAGIFWTLCTGGNLVISEKRIEQDISRIAHLIEKNKVGHTLMLPSLYKLLLDNTGIEQLENLKTVMVAGEACSPVVCKLHFKNLPNVALYNEYGPTEATVWCIAHQLREEEGSKGSIPIGKTVAGAEVFLLNDTQQLVPYGSVGELYIGGPGLSGSYLNRPDLTNEMYIECVLDDGVKRKLYKTGDLGRYNSSGDIEFLGRADQQIKIRGFRIELNEIENVVREYKAVQDVVVLLEEPNFEADDKIAESTSTVNGLVNILKYLKPEEANALLASVETLNDDEKEYLLNRIQS